MLSNPSSSFVGKKKRLCFSNLSTVLAILHPLFPQIPVPNRHGRTPECFSAVVAQGKAILGAGTTFGMTFLSAIIKQSSYDSKQIYCWLIQRSFQKSAITPALHVLACQPYRIKQAWAFWDAFPLSTVIKSDYLVTESFLSSDLSYQQSVSIHRTVAC